VNQNGTFVPFYRLAFERIINMLDTALHCGDIGLSGAAREDAELTLILLEFGYSQVEAKTKGARKHS
jgi:hypothetical protein